MAEEDKPDSPQPAKKAQAEKKAPTSRPRKVEANPNFQHLVRIADTDLDGNLQAVIALSRVRGVGLRTSRILLQRAKVPMRNRMGDLVEADVERIAKELSSYAENTPPWLHNRRSDWVSGDDMHLISADIQAYDRDDKNRMRKIRCYRGVRHEQGKKVRGQRTKSNGRRGLSLGVIRSKIGAPAAGATPAAPAEVKPEAKPTAKPAPKPATPPAK